jgi:putative membrane protein
MVMRLDDSAKARLHATVAAVEETTSAEIVCMVVRRAGDYTLFDLTLAIAAAMLLPGLLLPFAQIPALYIWGAQIATLGACFWGSRRLALGCRSERPERRARAARAGAEAQFSAHDLERSEVPASVLIYVALAERRMEIIADREANAAVDPTAWQSVLSQLERSLAARDLESGLHQAIARAGEILAPHFPPCTDNPDQLPNVVFD